MAAVSVESVESSFQKNQDNNVEAPLFVLTFTNITIGCTYKQNKSQIVIQLV
jgi:hypothetical protein